MKEFCGYRLKGNFDERMARYQNLMYLLHYREAIRRGAKHSGRSAQSMWNEAVVNTRYRAATMVS